MGGASSEVRLKGETKAEMFERFGQDGKIPEMPELPNCVDHVVGWFFDLSNRRGSGMAGGLPIMWNDIRAWAYLMNELPSQEEIGMILAMDRAFLEEANKDDSESDDGRHPTDVLKGRAE